MKNFKQIIKNWRDKFNANDISILEVYSKDAVLLATFGEKIMRGRKEIAPYFKGLFEKKNLSVTFEKQVYINNLEDACVFSGEYTFQYSENDEIKKFKTRYSFVVENNYIVTHHSSLVPEN